jgi:hypothetical protein
MAERNKNIFKRQIISFNPNFRIDTANPQMGLSGTDVYKIYGVTDNGDNQSSISLSSGGLLSLYNDRTIQISGGTKHEKGREDVVIIGNNGNVSITASGMVRIRATSIMLEADEDIQLKAGRNIDIKSGSGRTLLQGNKLDMSAQTGNLIDELGKGFLKSVFSGSFVGGDFLNGFIGGVSSAVLNSVI